MLQKLEKASVPTRQAKRPEGDRSGRALLLIGLLVVLLAVAALASLMTGASDAPAIKVLMAWAGLADRAELRAADLLIMEAIRLPRIIMGILIGASLAVFGAVMQGMFRIQLADPGLVGVSAGASLGAVTMIVLGGTSFLAPFMAVASTYALPFAAFLGGLASTLLLYRVATRQGRTSVATMLLAGIALGAFAGAATGILVYLANDAQLRELTFWGLGSLAGATWAKIGSAAPIILLALAATPFLARALNALALGESAAHHMGIPVQRMKNIAIVTVAAATGAAVAVSGGIGFVGIVVPHLLRLIIGPDHRYLLPAAGLLGATFLIGADAIARTIVAPAELPIGIVTAFFGAPFFLWILLRRRSILDL